jgi:hypothetical protein
VAIINQNGNVEDDLFDPQNKTATTGADCIIHKSRNALQRDNSRVLFQRELLTMSQTMDLTMFVQTFIERLLTTTNKNHFAQGSEQEKEGRASFISP